MAIPAATAIGFPERVPVVRGMISMMPARLPMI